ncbi:MAG TPA: ABC transporter ATP-binding protein [Gammaproteobacteria bacterium]|jgi:putrescine transport system ATP-binding protein|nr:polyamine ABC transporter ATP-binding protein [Gammaproteobacteria bacterium]HAT26432.1 polyamine ABC transporter ATP-binding protein [Gammaproteobacteria bacterium]HIA59861.1 ABC transporter ATP-binding protein [Gammaproteobacteria bacterium]HIF88104.1 ABC transporter ATP-binding protein [Gammaproteobacteria bacterium]HIN90350.1 ABC transporter ATP-binding protein [Porticoccaceae bacterium]|tara:strand:+ start:35762 stop:36898 length:1137 start_codon:yes stop_codon:yes gene_type:complete
MTTTADETTAAPEPSAESYLQIRSLCKDFDGITAVDQVNLDINKGELFAILGASGCGKSTLLRMLAGLETPTSGRIVLDSEDITDWPAYERPINMMFQSYALFPHMTVEKNIAYGLKKEKIEPDEIDQRVKNMLDLVQLKGFDKRKPNRLSGGEKQRVALARALIKNPKLLLLDEPLAALDKKLREQTQFELMNLQEELGVTFIVVTHDQEEAMTLATRIAVMNSGKFIQTGTPTEIYEYPSNRFVADFFGTINIFDARVINVTGRELTVEVDQSDIQMKAYSDKPVAIDDNVGIAVRPEKISISKQLQDGANITATKGVVEDLAYYGNYSIYRVKTESGQLVQVSAQNQTRSSDHVVEWEDEVYLSWEQNSSIVLVD